MEDGEKTTGRPDRRRRVWLAAPLFGVLGLAVAATVFYVLQIVEAAAPDTGTDLPAEPVQIMLGGLAVVAVLVGLAAVSGTLAIHATGVGKERRIPLAGLAYVSGVLSALLLIPVVMYIVTVFLNDSDDPALWELGQFALVTTSLGVVGLAAAAYEWWLVAITDVRPQGPQGDRAGP